MADAMQSRSALRAVLQPGSGGSPQSPGLTIQERRPLTVVQLSEIPGIAGPRAQIETALGMALPPARKSSMSGLRSTLWVGPGRWFVVEPGTNDLAAVLDRVAAGAFAITDLSHSRTVLRVSGAKVRDVLAQGCAIDLHPRSVSAGDSIVAGFARYAVVLHVIDSSPTVDLYVYRSYGQDLVEWLTEAAAQYGFRIIAEPISDASELQPQE